jgi:LPS-assembly lipoprotein
MRNRVEKGGDRFMRRLYVVTAVILAAALMQGCGFHLRGQVKLPPSLSAPYVESTDPVLKTQVEDMLRFSGSNPVTGADVATAVVKLFDVKYERVVRTVDNRGKATSYVLNYTASYSAADKSGKTLVGPQSVNVQRDYNFDATQVLAKEGEEAFLRHDMERDAAQQIVRQLAAGAASG